jgi:hypothetical protein
MLNSFDLLLLRNALDLFLAFVVFEMLGNTFQCLCGAPHCRGWLGKSPQEFNVEKLGTSKKKFEQKQQLAAKSQTKVNPSPSSTAQKKSALNTLNTPHPRAKSGVRKRGLDVDEFGLSVTQRRMQIQAMEKLQQNAIQKNQGVEGSSAADSLVSVTAKKRALERDEFGLTASQRQMQLEAFAKLRRSDE